MENSLVLIDFYITLKRNKNIKHEIKKKREEIGKKKFFNSQFSSNFIFGSDDSFSLLANIDVDNPVSPHVSRFDTENLAAFKRREKIARITSSGPSNSKNNATP